MLTVYTIGHSTRTTDEFVGLLNDYGVNRLVDIRTVHRSRHNPQFGRDVVQEVLQAASIRYLDVYAGRCNASFRAYANYLQTPEFAAGIDELVDLAGEATTGVMCAEAVP
ncbi:DUF488 family protein [Nocardia salmonicida]|uniref:DUF488 family protein n=1 Tax=Nocardia salmonicida TaxID=53431 RepID=UPI0037A97DD4